MAVTAEKEQTPVPSVAKTNWGAIRSRYPAADRYLHLGIASSNVISNAANAAAQHVIESKWLGDDDPGLKPKLPAIRNQFARLIKADASEIAVTTNVTEGLNIIAGAIDWREGDNMVLCPELEHPNNIYVWLALQDRGVEIRPIKAKNSAYDTDAIVAAIDENTRLVTTCSVTFAPGFRTELGRIGRACREMGALYLVDGVQSCGILDVDVARDCIDAMAASTSKGLLGITGLGFLYVREELIPELRPAYIGRYGVKRGDGHYSEYEGLTFELLEDAQRYEAGNYNWAGVAAANASLEELLELGTDVIEKHAVELAEAFADGLKALGLPVTEPPDGVGRSHIVTVGELDSGDTTTTNNPQLDRIASVLTDNNVKFTIRKGLLRFAFHCYNDMSDVDAALRIIKPAC
jgi:cysteine desulfurase/selenocysteine lyase